MRPAFFPAEMRCVTLPGLRSSGLSPSCEEGRPLKLWIPCTLPLCGRLGLHAELFGLPRGEQHCALARHFPHGPKDTLVTLKSGLSAVPPALKTLGSKQGGHCTLSRVPCVLLLEE